MNELMARAGEIITAEQDNIITAKALGSSLGICLYDRLSCIGGFVECLLPNSNSQDLRSCYVDSGIHLLYEALQTTFGTQEHLIAKMVGGANLFQVRNGRAEDDIGHQNIKMAYEVLMQLNIPIAAADVGDTFGRTIHFHLDDGSVYIETKRGCIYHI